MKITKYAHACMFVEDNGKRLVIDPGVLTDLPVDVSNISVIVVTHTHDDHLGKENIAKIIAANPRVTILANSQVMKELSDFACEKITVDSDLNKQVGGFDLEITNGDHAVIYEIAPCQNLRLVVNGQLYYPGDTLISLGKSIKAVAVPLSAPWSKKSEVIEFIKNSDAEVFFPVHDATLSDIGHTYQNSGMADHTKGKSYRILEAGESLEV